jgi:hypothetical protein
MQFSDGCEAQQCRAALLEIVIHSAGGRRDGRSLAKVERLCAAAMAVVEDDAECAAHVDAVAHYARALFSERAHRKWDRGSITGADFLRLEIVRTLHCLNRRLCALEERRREASARAAQRWNLFALGRASPFSIR